VPIVAELDLLALLERHVELYNDAVASGEFGPLLATFARQAVMSFDDVPLGPFRGLVEIRNAYATRTFTDPMALIDMEKVGPDAVTASFEWDAGGTRPNACAGGRRDGGAGRVGWLSSVDA
jgi:hypothetical protein